MVEEILVVYKTEVDGMKAQLKGLQTEQLKVDANAVQTSKTMQEGFNKTEVKVKSLKTQLKELKAALANATDPKEIERLAKATGKLSDQIQDASDAAKIFASDSKFEQVANGLGSVASKLRSLDFEGAAAQSKLLLAASKSITFEDAVKGAKDLGTTLMNTGRAVLGNPLLILAAVMVAVGVEAYGAAKALFTMNDNTKAVTDSIKESEKAVRSYRDAVQEAYIKIGEAIGSVTKGQADQKRTEIKNNNELIAIKDKYKTDVDAIAKEILGDEKATQADIAAAGLVGGIKGAAQLQRFNAQKLILDERYNLQRNELTKRGNAENLSIQVADNISRADAAKKETAKLLADAEAANKKREADNKAAIDKRNADDKFLRDLITQNIADAYLRERTALENKLSDDIELHKNNLEIIAELEKGHGFAINELDTKFHKERIQNVDSLTAALNQSRTDNVERELQGGIQTIEIHKKTEEQITADLKEQIAERQKVTQAASTFAISLINSINQVTQRNLQSDIEAAEESKNTQIAKLDEQLKNKEISQDQYDQRKIATEKQIAAETAAIKKKAWEADKQASLVTTIISTAQATIAALGSKPFTPANIALSALVAAAGAVQIALIASQPTPKFARGVVGLQGDGTETSDSIHAMLSRGESVITAEQTSKNKDLLIAMNKGKASEYIMRMLIAPALQNQRKEFERNKQGAFADNLSKSLMLNSKSFYDGNILESLKILRKSDKANAELIAGVIRSGQFNKRKW